MKPIESDCVLLDLTSTMIQLEQMLIDELAEYSERPRKVRNETAWLLELCRSESADGTRVRRVGERACEIVRIAKPICERHGRMPYVRPDPADMAGAFAFMQELNDAFDPVEVCLVAFVLDLYSHDHPPVQSATLAWLSLRQAFPPAAVLRARQVL
jgi:hypothetical protein